jgi:hypothetical protein
MKELAVRLVFETAAEQGEWHRRGADDQPRDYHPHGSILDARCRNRWWVGGGAPSIAAHPRGNV